MAIEDVRVIENTMLQQTLLLASIVGTDVVGIWNVPRAGCEDITRRGDLWLPYMPLLI